MHERIQADRRGRGLSHRSAPDTAVRPRGIMTNAKHESATRAPTPKPHAHQPLQNPDRRPNNAAPHPQRRPQPRPQPRQPHRHRIPRNPRRHTHRTPRRHRHPPHRPGCLSPAFKVIGWKFRAPQGPLDWTKPTTFSMRFVLDQLASGTKGKSCSHFRWSVISFSLS